MVWNFAPAEFEDLFQIAFDTRSLLLSAYIKTPQKHLNYFKKVV